MSRPPKQAQRCTCVIPAPVDTVLPHNGKVCLNCGKMLKGHEGTYDCNKFATGKCDCGVSR
jgi:hypothetical protein